MNRLGIALLINQLLVSSLGTLLSFAQKMLISALGLGDLTNAVMLVLKCVAYFVAFTLPIWVFNLMIKYVDREEYAPQNDGKKASPVDLACALVIGLGFVDMFSIVNYYAVKSILPHYSEYTHQNFWSMELKQPYQIILYFIYVAIIPAIVEELLFRKTVCDALLPYGKASAILFSAIFFSLMHSNIEQLLYTFVAGVFLAWLYVEGKSILLPMLLHFLNNGKSVLLNVISQNASTGTYTNVSFVIDMIVLLLTALALVIVLLKLLKMSAQGKKEPSEEVDNEITMLTKAQKASGFLSIGMILYVAYCLGTVALYIYKSLV